MLHRLHAQAITLQYWLNCFWQFIKPDSFYMRVFIGLYMFVTGIARVITGNSASSVNILPSRIYGLLLVIGAIFLLATVRTEFRCHMLGRSAAIVCAALWLLVIAQAWPAQAWVSISGGFVFVLALAFEVRTYAEC
jgi:uncharacterized membrane protein